MIIHEFFTRRMRIFMWFIFCLILFGCNTDSIIQKDSVIACIGDSVTYGGENGYPELLQEYVKTHLPDKNLTILNWGKNSETITHLTEYNHPGPRPYLFDRLDSLLQQSPKPDIVTFCYGINCGIYGEPSSELFDLYRKGINKFLDRMQKENIKVIMLTPPPLALGVAKKNGNTKLQAKGQNYSWLTPYKNYDKEVLQEFKKIVFEINHPSIIKKIDIRLPLSKQKDQAYGWDPIHPNDLGNDLIAKTLIKALF